ncbi:hypothetical protein [Luteibacter sp.]|uniref:hypothetical protein n=1 Tax=Luteibacter sp. TaxID=1886636 RepID=UPI0028076E23|nr:hypothetical protein [Luteibacter sp.]MDQ8050863.1 hypothetical protein [Luteibacter sp.]
MKGKLFAGFLTTVGICLVLLGALFLCVAALGENPVRLWQTEHTYYQFVPNASPWTLPIGGGSVIAGIALVIASLRLWQRQR